MDDLEANEFTDDVGVIAEDLHLTQCAQECSTGTEDDQAEQQDYGTIDEVLGDPHTERGGDAPEEADRDADPPEQIPLLGYPESRPYSFNHEVRIDVFEIIDSVSMRFLTLDAVCMRVAYVRAWVKRDHSRQACKPTSATGHVGLAGSKMHDRGVLSSILIENGVVIRPGGLGKPEQISRAGRRGDMSKKMMTKTIKDTYV